jgi:hypothetical protein
MNSYHYLIETLPAACIGNEQGASGGASDAERPAAHRAPVLRVGAMRLESDNAPLVGGFVDLPGGVQGDPFWTMVVADGKPCASLQELVPRERPHGAGAAGACHATGVIGPGQTSRYTTRRARTTPTAAASCAPYARSSRHAGVEDAAVPRSAWALAHHAGLALTVAHRMGWGRCPSAGRPPYL